MARLLDHNLPLAPDQYDPETFQLILRDLEVALTKTELPEVIEGRDNARSMAWFLS